MSRKKLIACLIIGVIAIGNIAVHAAFIAEHSRLPHGAEIWNWVFLHG